MKSYVCKLKGRTVAVLCALLIGAACTLRLYIPAMAVDTAAVTDDANWIMTAVLSSPSGMAGAIANYPDQQHIRPYMANLACLGLSQATQYTGNTSYNAAVWSYLNWYAAHMDTNGYIHDFDYINGAWAEAPNSQTTAAYDSTDAYAGTFLMAIKVAYLVDSDTAKLALLKPAISKAIDAILSTQQPDGLTWATPAFHVKYLEDNAETLAGMQAAQSLADVLGDQTLSQKAKVAADQLAAGINDLWNDSTSSYYWAKHEDGTLQSTDWTQLGDAMQQASVLAYGIAPSNQATVLLNQINVQQPNWYDPTQNGNNYDLTFMGWGYTPNGDAATASTAANTLRATAISSNRAWPFTTMAAGELIILETGGSSLVTRQPTVPTPPPSSNTPQLPSVSSTDTSSGSAAGTAPQPRVSRTQPRVGASTSSNPPPSAPTSLEVPTTKLETGSPRIEPPTAIIQPAASPKGRAKLAHSVWWGMTVLLWAGVMSAGVYAVRARAKGFARYSRGYHSSRKPFSLS